MAHRLQLAAGHAFESLPIFIKFEEMISGLYNFYNNKGHRRKGHLKETAAALEATYYELTALFKIRWISSEFAAVHKIYKSYGILVNDLNSILLEDWADGITKAQAQGLLRLLTDKNLIEFMHFIMDILNTLSYLSEKLQERYGSVLGTPSLMQSVAMTLDDRISKKTEHRFGRFELAFYREAQCYFNDGGKVTVQLCNDDESYGRAFQVSHHGEILDDKLKLVRENDFRKKYIILLVQKMADYFPSSNYTIFKALNPLELPTETENILDYGLASIREIAKSFSLSPDATLREWQLLLPEIVTSSEFKEYRNADPVIFWGKMLANTGLPWQQNFKKLIQIALVLPIGSSDAERGFSILKHSHYDRRSRLKEETLDSILRIGINGPEISDFDALRYARLWAKEGKLLTDSTASVSEKVEKRTTQEVREGLKEKLIVPDISSGKFERKKYLRGSNIF